MATALVVLAVFFAVVAATGWVAVWRLRRPLMLDRRVVVPLSWRWSLSRQAVLHKRLLVAVGTMRHARPPTGGAPWDSLMGDVEAMASSVDRELVQVERQARVMRRRSLPPLEARVAEVEKLAGRVTDSLRSWRSGNDGRSGEEILERLAAVDSALAELEGPAPQLGPAPAPGRGDGEGEAGGVNGRRGAGASEASGPPGGPPPRP